jgi:paraquat-inducible protein A
MRVYKVAEGIEKLTGVFFLTALFLWGTGVSLPVLHVTELFFFESYISLSGIVFGLFQQGEWIVGSLIFTFTLLLPPLKLGLGYFLWRFSPIEDSRSFKKKHTVLEGLGKWAMLDVMVLALVVATLKSNWIAEITVAHGLYPFVASALIAAAAPSSNRADKEKATRQCQVTLFWFPERHA